MKTLTPIDLNELILDHYDPDELLEMLGITTEDLVDRFPDVIWTRRHEFRDFYHEEDADYEPYET